MIHDRPMPELSSAFTIEDIHKIREWDYERLKDAAQRIRAVIEEIRKSKAKV